MDEGTRRYLDAVMDAILIRVDARFDAMQLRMEARFDAQQARFNDGVERLLDRVNRLEGKDGAGWRLKSMKYLLLVAVLIAPAAAQEVRPITRDQVCTTHWGKDERHVSAAMKRHVFERDGYPLGNKDPRGPFEIDHIVPRSLGGADTMANLQVQQYFGHCNAHEKDRLETQGHRDVCDGTVGLGEAQSWFTDWEAAYRRRFGKPC